MIIPCNLDTTNIFILEEKKKSKQNRYYRLISFTKDVAKFFHFRGHFCLFRVRSNWSVPASNSISSPQRYMQYRVFQNFWGNGNQRFLSTTLAPDRRETLRFAKKLRFLLSPGLQRRLGVYIMYYKTKKVCSIWTGNFLSNRI